MARATCCHVVFWTRIAPTQTSNADSAGHQAVCGPYASASASWSQGIVGRVHAEGSGTMTRRAAGRMRDREGRAAHAVAIDLHRQRRVAGHADRRALPVVRAGDAGPAPRGDLPEGDQGAERRARREGGDGEEAVVVAHTFRDLDRPPADAAAVGDEDHLHPPLEAHPVHDDRRLGAVVGEGRADGGGQVGEEADPPLPRVGRAENQPRRVARADIEHEGLAVHRRRDRAGRCTHPRAANRPRRQARRDAEIGGEDIGGAVGDDRQRRSRSGQSGGDIAHRPIATDRRDECRTARPHRVPSPSRHRSVRGRASQSWRRCRAARRNRRTASST